MQKKILKLDISLYPKGKYIGYVSKIMREKLEKIGVKILISKEAKVFVK